MTIRCSECDKLLAVKNGNYFEIKSKHDFINISTPCVKIICKCGKVWILNTYTPYVYSLPLEEMKEAVYKN